MRCFLQPNCREKHRTNLFLPPVGTGYELRSGRGTIDNGNKIFDKVLKAYGEADDIYGGDVEDLYFWYAGEDHQIECEMDIQGETQQVIRMRMLRS